VAVPCVSRKGKKGDRKCFCVCAVRAGGKQLSYQCQEDKDQVLSMSPRTQAQEDGTFHHQLRVYREHITWALLPPQGRFKQVAKITRGAATRGSERFLAIFSV